MGGTWGKKAHGELAEMVDGLESMCEGGVMTGFISGQLGGQFGQYVFVTPGTVSIYLLHSNNY